MPSFIVIGDGDNSAWLMNCGRYADESTIEVFIGTEERANKRAAELTVQATRNGVPADLVAVTPNPISIFIDRP
jgi:hypothetical protein